MLYTDIGLISTKDTRYGFLTTDFQTKVSKDNILIDLSTELQKPSRTLQSRVVYDTNDLFTEISAGHNISQNSALVTKVSWLGYPCIGVGLAAKVQSGNLDAKTLFTISTNSIKRQDFELKMMKNNSIFWGKIEIATEKSKNSLFRFSGKIEKNENSAFFSMDSQKNSYFLISKKFKDLKIGFSATKMHKKTPDFGLKCELNV